jgi:hypothetical protein
MDEKEENIAEPFLFSPIDIVAAVGAPMDNMALKDVEPNGGTGYDAATENLEHSLTITAGVKVATLIPLVLANETQVDSTPSEEDEVSLLFGLTAIPENTHKII